MRAASLFRSEETEVYEIDEQKPAAEFWTASDSILEALEQLYTVTEHNLRDRTRLLGTAIDEVVTDAGTSALSKQKKDQMTKLI